MRPALPRTSATVRLFGALLCLGVALSAHAGKRNDDAIRRQAESSLLVSGHVTISADGKVLSHRLDDVKALPEGLAGLTAHLASKWTFEPVALGDAKASRSRMRLLYVAKQQADGKLVLELRSASFEAELPKEATVRVERRTRMPEYPPNPAASNAQGTVYLQLQIGRDGKVMNIDASHVNLRTIGSEAEMSRWRQEFSEASIKAISTWTFLPPTQGPVADAPYWTGTILASFNGWEAPRPKPGKWEAYIPGPRKVIPWLDSKGLTAEQTDALAPNQFHSTGNSRRLTSPLMGG